MEASQASEAGSIPVARSSPARPRAGRFCYAHFAPTVDRMRRDNRRNTFPARAGARGSGTKLALHAQNLPIWRVLPLLGAVLSRFCCQQAEHGEFCPATTSNKTGTPPLPVQNSPHTSHTVPVPVQNSPCTPKISPFGAFCSCWESFIPFLLPTSRAWRVFSRTNTSTTTGTKETTPPHNTQSHAMKDYPPTLHRQHHTMKHSSPQHATNNQNSPTFTMQGRTFFHNTHHTPTPGRHFFQPTPLPAK